MATDRFRAAARRRQLRAQAIAYLGGRCDICGYDGCPMAFDFHHLDPAVKDFTISDRMTSWEAIQPELAKCVLLCARCHREVHDGWHPSYLVGEDRGREDDEEVFLVEDEPDTLEDFLEVMSF